MVALQRPLVKLVENRPVRWMLASGHLQCSSGLSCGAEAFLKTLWAETGLQTGTRSNRRSCQVRHVPPLPVAQTLTGTLSCTWFVSVVIGQGQLQVPAETRRVKSRGQREAGTRGESVFCEGGHEQTFRSTGICGAYQGSVSVHRPPCACSGLVCCSHHCPALGTWGLTSLMAFRTVLDSSFFWGLPVATWGPWGAGLAVSVQPSVFTKVQ